MVTVPRRPPGKHSGQMQLAEAILKAVEMGLVVEFRQPPNAVFNGVIELHVFDGRAPREKRYHVFQLIDRQQLFDARVDLLAHHLESVIRQHQENREQQKCSSS
jgi:hypothetical protein